MGLNRKKTSEFLSDIQRHDFVEREVFGVWIEEGDFDLAMDLIKEQQQVIEQMGAKIKNLRSNLRGLNINGMIIRSRLNGREKEVLSCHQKLDIVRKQISHLEITINELLKRKT